VHDKAGSESVHTGGSIIISGIELPEDVLWRFRLDSGTFSERLDVDAIKRVFLCRGESVERKSSCPRGERGEGTVSLDG
jgi:hypothetical protein